MRLARQAREVKRTAMGSLDTVGVRGGDDIAPHVAACLWRDLAAAATGGEALPRPCPVGPATGAAPSACAPAGGAGAAAAAEAEALREDSRGANGDAPRCCLTPSVLRAALAVPLDPRDARDNWWTSLDSKDSAEALALRFRDVFMTVRHDAPKGRAVVLVGHSLFFRELVRCHLDPSGRVEAAVSARGASAGGSCSAKAAADFVEALREKKLDNGACLCLDLEWVVGPGADPMAPPVIVNASLFCGSRFKEKEKKAKIDDDLDSEALAKATLRNFIAAGLAPDDGTGGGAGAVSPDSAERRNARVLAFRDPRTGAEHESSEPDKEGFLLKRSDWPEQWRRRHVALKGPRLFFADDSGGAPTAMVDLRGFGVSVGPSTVTAAGPGHAYALHVATRERTFLLGTDDARERDGWVESLRSAMAT